MGKKVWASLGRAVPNGVYHLAFLLRVNSLLSQNNVNSCLKSCEFLAEIKNFSSILAGDGSLPPSPSIPIIRNRTLTSISLEWVPVENTSGTPVYLVEMDYSASGSMYLSEVDFSFLRDLYHS